MKVYRDKSDEQLISLYVDGKNEAFDALLERHKDRLFMYIYHAVKNEDAANDIFQDTFVKAIMTIKQGRYVENGHFPAWITRIAHNHIIDYYRQIKAENLQSTDDGEVNILNRKELAASTIEDDIITTQIHDDVKRLIKALQIICHLQFLLTTQQFMRTGIKKDLPKREVKRLLKTLLLDQL